MNPSNRRIVLDTETTGMPAREGHRIIEIGCVEMIDREITGQTYHQYINPERNVDSGAYEVHGISDTFLSDKPKISACIDAFLAFVDGAELIIHNASFDVGFLDCELERLNRKERINAICRVTDTLAMARKKHPGARANLDALTKRYGINHFNREHHGALLDAEILAHVYLAMTGGQEGLHFSQQATQEKTATNNPHGKKRHAIVEVPLSEAEIAQHQKALSEK